MSSPPRALPLVILTLWLSVGLAQRCAADDADQILAAAESRHRSTSQEYAGDVVVTSRNGTERRKLWRSYREGTGGTANRLIRFLGPPEVRGVAFLSRGRPGANPDQWMYLPAMKRERRVAPQDRESSFVGTDFNYEDLEELDRTQYAARLVADDAVDGQPCYAIELLPKVRSVYAKKLLVLQKDTLIPRRLEAFRRGDTVASKVLRFSDYVQVDGHWVARRMEMTDDAKRSRTTLALSDVRFDRPQPADRFTIQNLVREDAEAVPPVGERPPSRRFRGFGGREQSVFGQSGSPASPSRPARRPWLGALTGFVQTKLVLLPTSRTSADTHAVGSGDVFLRQTATIGRARLVGALMAQAVSARQQGTVAWDPIDRQARRSPLSLREVFVTVPVAPAVDLTAGRFTPAWGRTETYSPQDAFLPRDATDPLASEKLPLWGVRLAGDRGPYRFEAYRALVTTPWRLPRMDGRYSPFGAFDVFLDEPTGAPPTRGFTVVRVTRTGGTWDLGGWARSGVRPAPLLSGDLDEARDAPAGRFISPTRRFVTEHAGGLDVGRFVGGWMLRGEAAVMTSPDADLGTATIVTFEAERSTGNATLVVTLAGIVPRPAINSLLLFDRASLPAAMLSWNQQQTWGQWKLSWLGTLDKIGGLLRLETANHLTDAWTLTIGADLPHGARVSPLGAFDAARRVYSATKVSW